MNSPRPRTKTSAAAVPVSPEEIRQNWLMRILDAAIVKVPAVKYALGVAGVFVVVAIVVGLNVDYRVALFGTLATFVFMVLLLVFAKLASASPKVFVGPVTVLLWAFMLLAIATSILLVTSMFFRVPVDLQGWLRPASPGPTATVALPLTEVLATAEPPRAASPSVPLAVDVRLFARRAGANGLALLGDGETLATNDDFCIVVSPGAAGYLYVLQQDATGHVQWLFPAHDGAAWASGTNPVSARLPLTLPPTPGATFYLDSNVGTETVVVVFSATPWPALEAALHAQLAPRANAPAPDLARLSTFRGIGGMRRIEARPLSIPAPAAKQLDGRVYDLPAPSELQSSENFLVLRRSFQHVDANR